MMASFYCASEGHPKLSNSRWELKLRPRKKNIAQLWRAPDRRKSRLRVTPMLCMKQEVGSRKQEGDNIMRKLILSLLVLFVIGSFTSSIAEVTLRIESQRLEIRVTSVKMGDSFPCYIGEGPVIKILSSATQAPIAFIDTADDGKSYGYTLGEVNSNPTFLALELKCEVTNLGTTQKSFEIGDITLSHKTGTAEFAAVGIGHTPPFLKSEKDQRIVKKSQMNIGPTEKLSLTYIFAVPRSASLVKLVYKGKNAVDLKQ